MMIEKPTTSEQFNNNPQLIQNRNRNDYSLQKPQQLQTIENRND